VYRLSDPGFDGEIFADGVEPSKACCPVLPVVCLKGVGMQDELAVEHIERSV